MKLSLSNIAWDIHSNDEIFRFMENHSFYGLEIAPSLMFGTSPYDNQKQSRIIAKNLFKKYHLKIVSMQSLWYGKTERIFESEENQRVLLDYTKASIDLANTIECNILVFGCPKNRIINSENEYNMAYDFFESIGEHAIKKGVFFCLEPNPVIYGTNFLNTTMEAIEFCRKLDNKGVGVNLDYGTIIYNNEAIDFSDEEMSYIKHVHLSEPMLIPIVKREEHKVLKKVLERTQYDGCVSIEMVRTENKDDIIKAGEYLKEVFG